MDIDNVVRARDVAVVQLFGQVTITGASGAVASQTSYGFTVTYVSAGKYLCTLDRLYPELLFAIAIPQLSTATECVLQLTENNMAAGTLSFLNTTNGAAAELATATVLNIMIVLKDSTVAP